MVGKDGSQTHGASMEDGLVAQAAETGMSVDYLYTFANDDIPKNGEKREDGRESRLSVDDEKGNIIDFQAICEVAYTSPAFVGVRYNDDFVSAIYKFLVGMVSDEQAGGRRTYEKER